MYDVAVVGGGIVGLATAHRLLSRSPGLSLIVLEKESRVATHQTGHNSGVIHSGIYYRPGSLKASICRAGVDKLLHFCDEYGVRYELCGKLIVATTEDEYGRLDGLIERGRENGVPDLRKLSPDEMRDIEPHACGLGAIHSPTTGIVSFREVAEKIAEVIEARGGDIWIDAALRGVKIDAAGLHLETTRGRMDAKRVITCAGLHADRVARLFGDTPGVSILPFRGEYYRLKPDGQKLVRALVYPVPDPRFPFLGTHLTTRIDGEVEAGPNAVLALAREGYRKTDFDFGDLGEMARSRGLLRMMLRYGSTGLSEYHRSLSKTAFVKSLQKLVPELKEDDLEPGGSGVRAMALDPDGSLVDDFRIVQTSSAIHVLSAPSPAATSAFAIAEHIAAIARS
ncbi:MAG TPA: L-2-hydroxyglutarate oxidase [Vicinamibacteria bacterium]|nr:L-2-hydroxyglutarate oxidase [Vicinamibacteria bacterium]